MRIGLLHSRIRVEEKLLLKEFAALGVEVDPIDVRDVKLSLDQPEPWRAYDVIFDRCLSHSQSLTIATILEAWGIPCLNAPGVNRICGNKIEMSAVLTQRGIPTIPVLVSTPSVRPS